MTVTSNIPVEISARHKGRLEVWVSNGTVKLGVTVIRPMGHDRLATIEADICLLNTIIEELEIARGQLAEELGQ